MPDFSDEFDCERVDELIQGMMTLFVNDDLPNVTVALSRMVSALIAGAQNDMDAAAIKKELSLAIERASTIRRERMR